MDNMGGTLLRWPRQLSGKQITTALIVCFLLVFAAPVTPVHAATLTVTSLADDNSAGTLRKAISDAKGGDVITFQAGLTGTLTLNSQLTIAKALSIVGPGTQALTISGGNNSRVFMVTKSGVPTISGLTIANGAGKGGGNIVNDGLLIIQKCMITGGVSGEGPGGGGIISTATGIVSIADSTISGNDAGPLGSGGGIFSQGELTVVTSTITGNKAGKDGGGIASDTAVGAKPIIFANSTVSGNDAGNTGGGIWIKGSAFMRHVTVANNTAKTAGGGLFLASGTTLDIGNTLIATNTTANAPFDFKADFDNGGTLANQGSNFISAIAGAFPVKPSDIIRNNSVVLGPLADNGGPTKTHALLPGSAPVDKGNIDVCADPNVGKKDQRGVARPKGAGCDIGAFELDTPTTPTTSTAPTTTTPPTSTTPTSTSPTSTTACAPFAPGSAFGFPAFQSQWQQGEGLAPNFWGPTVTAALTEQYAETGGTRLVQYFDKGRMERGAGDAVTNGLLANELITGQMQVGDNAFMAKGAANIPVAGDPDNAGPTYAGLGTRGASLFAPTPSRNGALVTTTVAAAGDVTAGATTTGSGPTAIGAYDDATQHNVPQAFAQYRNRVGLLTIGLAKSEPFLATVKVGGVSKQVMIQVFERRVLTYTADNPDAFKVEFGNIGQHYYRWRYCGA